jgi:hypothetical protein
MSLIIDRYRHRCTIKHQTSRELLVHAIRALTRDEVFGEGEYALIHESRVYRKSLSGDRFTAFYRVNLFETEAEMAAAWDEQVTAHAVRAKCSNTCQGMPRAVRVVLS